MKLSLKQSFTGSDLCQLEAHQVVDLLRRKEVSPQELLEASLSRIEAVEPAINAIPTVCASRARDAIDHWQSAGSGKAEESGWLGGLPIGIKDLTPVKGVLTTFGSKGLANNIPAQSDPLVELLEQRGGIVVGKTNTPEMGAGGNTFNDVFGRTRNPYNTSLNAGGSSGGAAASLASGEVWLSHGSDLAGSLRTPAAYCGVVGFRPSPGRAGGGPSELGFHMEGLQGPMARSVTDCALFLDAMVGFDPRSPISLEAPIKPFQDAVRDPNSNVRIAYSPDLNGFAPVDPVIDHVLRQALEQVEKSGGMIEESCPQLPKLDKTYRVLRAALWASGPGKAPDSIQKHYKATLADNINYGRTMSVDDIYSAERDRTVLFHNMRRFLHDFDVLACPTIGVLAGPVEEEYPTTLNGQVLDDYLEWLRPSFLSTTTSLPSISLPVGFTDAGMPVGLQLIGPPRGEAKLLEVARQIELVLGGPLGPIDPVITHK